MSKHKYESAARNYNAGLMRLRRVHNSFRCKQDFLAGCDHVEKVNGEVAVKSFVEFAESKRGRDAFNPCDNGWKINEVEDAFATALEIGRKLEREKLQAENKALREDLKWVLNIHSESIVPEGTDGRAEEIRNKYFKDEALKEQGEVE